MSDSPSITAPPARNEPGRRERKRDQTLDHIAAAAWALFEQHGFETVTMEQIAAAADVAKGTLYKHFPVKEALLAHVFHAELAAGAPIFRERVSSLTGFAPRLREFLRLAADWSRPRRHYLAHYLRFRLTDIATHAQDAPARKSRSGMDRIFTQLIQAGQEAGELRRDLDPEHLANLFQFLHLGALMRWLATPDGDLDGEFAAVLSVFVDGIGADPQGGLPCSR